MESLVKSVTKTTNFYPFKFNKTNKCRDILFDGAVPLHKIVYNLYDFYYDYIHSASPKTITYLSLIINQTTDGRPETPYIIKLEGASSKKKRQEHIQDSIKELITFFNGVFAKFISSQGVVHDYRTDTNFKTLKKAHTDFNDTISLKLKSLLI